MNLFKQHDPIDKILLIVASCFWIIAALLLFTDSSNAIYDITIHSIPLLITIFYLRKGWKQYRKSGFQASLPYWIISLLFSVSIILFFIKVF